jgi:hypothetical protein
MAAPNFVTPAAGYLRNFAATVGTNSGTAATTVLSNPAASGKALKLSSLTLANCDTSSAVYVTCQLFNGQTTTVSYAICSGVSVPSRSTLTVVGRDSPVYLAEGDIIRAFTGSTSKVDSVASYEEVS